MCVSKFTEECKKSKFYFFKSVKDFDKRIDWSEKKLSNISFFRGLMARGEYDNRNNAIPTPFYAYGTKK